MSLTGRSIPQYHNASRWLRGRPVVRAIRSEVLYSGCSIPVVRTLRVRVDRVRFPAPRKRTSPNDQGKDRVRVTHNLLLQICATPTRCLGSADDALCLLHPHESRMQARRPDRGLHPVPRYYKYDLSSRDSLFLGNMSSG